MTETTPLPFNLETHNGVITIANPATGGHRTIAIRTQKADAKFAPGERIVSLLSGPDNEADYRGFAFLKRNRVLVWKSKRATAAGSRSVLEYLADMLERPAVYIERGITYHFEGRCRVCNRKLTTPESIESGIGPVCAGRA
jgi:hypothetical protein